MDRRDCRRNSSPLRANFCLMTLSSHHVSGRKKIGWMTAVALAVHLSHFAYALPVDDPKNAPIHEAAKAGLLDKVRAVLRLEPQAVNARNAFGATPLYFAAGTNHVAVAKFLLEKGADVNASSTVGQSPLAAASALGYHEMVRLLLANGARVNDRDKFRLTALHQAAAYGHRRSENPVSSRRRCWRQKHEGSDCR
jgi:hypothetical protein